MPVLRWCPNELHTDQRPLVRQARPHGTRPPKRTRFRHAGTVGDLLDVVSGRRPRDRINVMTREEYSRRSVAENKEVLNRQAWAFYYAVFFNDELQAIRYRGFVNLTTHPKG